MVDCNYESHGAAMLEIFNDAILHTTALYENDLRTMEFMRQWFADKEAAKHPVVGLLDDDDEGGGGGQVLVGFATFGMFRTRPCYRFTVEHSVYVDKRFRGRGYGKHLLEEILMRAEKDNYHCIVGVVDSNNAASIALHEKCGFSLCGKIRHAGFKFDRWLDTCILQKILSAADSPPP